MLLYLLMWRLSMLMTKDAQSVVPSKAVFKTISNIYDEAFFKNT